MSDNCIKKNILSYRVKESDDLFTVLEKSDLLKAHR